MSDSISLSVPPCSIPTVSWSPFRHCSLVSHAWWVCAISKVIRQTAPYTTFNPRCWCFFIFSPFFSDRRCLHGCKSQHSCLFNQDSRSLVFFSLSTLLTCLIFDTRSGALRHGFSITRLNRGLALISTSLERVAPFPPLSSMRDHEEGWSPVVQIKKARDEHELSNDTSSLLRKPVVLGFYPVLWKTSEKNRQKLVISWWYRDIISQLFGLTNRDIIIDIVAI